MSQRQNRTAKTFEIRHEHSRGRLRRAQSGAAAVEQRDGGAASDQLIGYRPANHAAPTTATSQSGIDLLISHALPAAPFEGQSRA